MSAYLDQYRQKVASGEIKPRTGGGLGEGLFECLIVSTEFGPGQKGDLRGCFKVKVVNADDPGNVGKMFNIYLQTKNPTMLETELSAWIKYCNDWKIEESFIFTPLCVTLADVAQSLCNTVGMLCKNGSLRLGIERKPKLLPNGVQQMDARGRADYWVNIQAAFLAEPAAPVSFAQPAPVAAPAAPIVASFYGVPVAAPVAAPVAQAAPAAAPVVQAAPAALAAPVVEQPIPSLRDTNVVLAQQTLSQPIAPAAPTKKFPWQK